MKQCLIVVDLSFMSYQVDVAQALANAGRLMQEGGAHSVTLEAVKESRPQWHASSKRVSP